MGKTLVEQLRADIESLRSVRTDLAEPMHEYLSDGGNPAYGLDDEQIGEALLLTAVWGAVRELERSSQRLERLTYVLAALTVTLVVQTAFLFAQSG